jgi:hypothetical protein
MAGYIFIGCVVSLIILLIVTRKNKGIIVYNVYTDDDDKFEKLNICKTSSGFDAMYVRKLAKHNEDICIQPVHGATWLYSTKDPGNGMENVVIATNDPELLKHHPEFGENESFNNYIKTK